MLIFGTMRRFLKTFIQVTPLLCPLGSCSTLSVCPAEKGTRLLAGR